MWKVSSSTNRISAKNIGQFRNPKSPILQSIAFFHKLSFSTVHADGCIRMPASLFVFVWAYQQTYIYPSGRSARTKHLSMAFAKFLYCWIAGCTKNSGPLLGETSCSTLSTTSSAVSGVLSENAYSDTSILVHPLACTSGLANVFCKCSLGQST